MEKRVEQENNKENMMRKNKKKKGLKQFVKSCVTLQKI